MLGNVFTQGVSLLLFVIITRFVSRESFGVMAVCLTTVEVVRRLFLEPIAFVTKARPSADDEDFNNAFTTVLFLSFVLAGVVYASAPLLAFLLSTPAVAEVLPVVAVIILAVGLSQVHSAWLARHMQFRALALRRAGAVIAGGVVGISMAVNGYGLWSLVGQQLALNLISLTFLWLASPWKPKLVFSRRWLSNIMPAAKRLSAGRLADSLQHEMDIYFVSAAMGPASAGLYNGAKRILLSLSLSLTHALTPVAVSALANTNDDQERHRLGLAGLAALSMATLPAFLGLGLVARDIVMIVLPPDWSSSGEILEILAIGGYFLAVHSYCSAMLSVAGRYDLDLRCSIIGAFFALVLYWVAAEHGGTAMAWAVTSVLAIVLPLRLEILRRTIGQAWAAVLDALKPSIIGAILMALSVTAIQIALENGDAEMRLLACVVAGIVAYSTILWAFFRRRSKDALAVFWRG